MPVDFSIMENQSLESFLPEIQSRIVNLVQLFESDEHPIEQIHEAVTEITLVINNAILSTESKHKQYLLTEIKSQIEKNVESYYETYEKELNREINEASRKKDNTQYNDLLSFLNKDTLLYLF